MAATDYEMPWADTQLPKGAQASHVNIVQGFLCMSKPKGSLLEKMVEENGFSL